MEREQIKKALECCLANDICDSKCGECQYKSTGAECMDWMLRDALALINSQEQRIGELTEENTALFARNLDLAEKGEQVVIAYKKLSEENEGLRYDVQAIDDGWAKNYEEMQEQLVASVKADTVRKMQERLKKEAYPFPCAIGVEYAVPYCKVDQIAKEMLEGEE